MAHKVGGQAVIEGVMMKTKHRVAIAVRKPDKKIKIKKQPFFPVSDKIKFLGWPFIRGITELFQIMVLGIKALNYSANESLGEKEEQLSTWHLTISLLAALVLAFVLFKFIPLGLTKLLYGSGAIGESRTLFNLIDGLLRIFIFIAYILIISMMSDVKRLFQYHGAEHKSVHCYEAGKPLTVKNVKKYSPLHTRCGTSFLVIVLLVAIIIFSLIRVDISFWYLLLLRIPLLLPIAGISYEILKFADKYHKYIFFRAVAWPGMLIQRITTSEPDNKQIEVAIAALKSVIKRA